MKFNINTIKNLFKRLQQSPIDDIALKAVNNADGIADLYGIVDDIPTVMSPLKGDNLKAVKNTLAQSNKRANLPKIDLNDIPSNAPNLPNIESFGDMARYVDNRAFPSIDDLTPPPTNDDIVEELTKLYDAKPPYVSYEDGILEVDKPEPTLLDLYNAGYKFDSTPDYNAMDIRPERFGQRKDLIDSVDFPDGFTNPDDFARYYDSLELGVIPE